MNGLQNRNKDPEQEQELITINDYKYLIHGYSKLQHRLHKDYSIEVHSWFLGFSLSHTEHIHCKYHQLTNR